MAYKAIVIGASAGGLDAIKAILASLPGGIVVPIIIVLHTSPHSDNYIVKHLNEICQINVKEADEKEELFPGTAYIAPPNYHLLIEKDHTLSLTVDPKVSYARPSIDVLFESAAEVYNNDLVGIILTGANRDGSNGLRRIKELGGLAIVQEPKTAYADAMPRAAIEVSEVDFIVTLDKISSKLIELIGEPNEQQ